MILFERQPGSGEGTSRLSLGIRVLSVVMFLVMFSTCAEAEDITNALRAFLQHRVEVEKKDAAIVIGIVDERGSRVVGCGKRNDGSDEEVDGDTLFEIGSVTKTFTALLLEDMVERGEVKFDDPVAKYLPASVHVPTRKGKEITLLHLATHTSGLPLLPDNLNPRRADNPYADYTVEKLTAFLEGYKLKDYPGAKYQYSELGMELLGHALALKAGTNYESLVVDRVCGPLKMNSTRVTLTPELRSRLSTGHDPLGNAVSSMEFQTLVGGSGLHSTANDLLKYLSANLGLAPSSLTPEMENTHAPRFKSLTQMASPGLAWSRARYPQGREFIVHGGATPGYTTFVGFDKAERRGVVVLCSSGDHVDVVHLGLYLLIGEWDPDRRPHETKTLEHNYESYIGEYQLTPDISLGILTLRTLYVLAPKLLICGVIAAGIGLIMVATRYVPFCRRRWNRRVTRWRARSVRRRWMIVGCIVCGIALSGLATVLITSRVAYWHAHPVVNVWAEGKRLFIQASSSSHVSSRIHLPHITSELVPVSDMHFFERLDGTTITFHRDAQGKVAGLSAPLLGNTLSCVKISDQPEEPAKPRAVTRLDPKLFDSCVGEYEFAADDLFPEGIKLNIRRQGDGLVGHASNTNSNWGAFEVYPLSETNFFFTLTVVGVELNFVKNAKGEVTSVVRHVDWLPDRTGRKLDSK